VQEQASQYLRVRTLLSEYLITLLLRYCFGVLSDRGRTLRRSICDRRDQDRTDGRTETDDYCSPVSQIPNIRCERTDLDSHNPSLLEPILP
jgi:hypothetical protein